MSAAPLKAVLGLFACALAGLTTALSLWCTEARVLIQEGAPRSGPCELPPPATPPARRALLVVVDAVRARLATLATVSPTLAALASKGASGVARVRSLLPSTVAGIEAIATGLSPPPLSIFQDWGASGARTGGAFAAAKAAGLSTFVVGPSLWVDLFGPWIDGSHTVDTVGSDDAYLMKGALPVLAARRHGLVVVHLGACDEATHRFGGGSRRYADCVRGYDAHLARLVAAAGDDTAIVVTSDHGASLVGGHAGPEEAVLDVPLVAAGPGLPRGLLPRLPQTCAGALALSALGQPWRGDEPPALAARSASESLALAVTFAALLFAALALTTSRATPRDLAFLALALLATLAATLARRFELGGFVGAGAVLLFGVARVRIPRLISIATPLSALAGCALFGAWRLVDAFTETGARAGALEGHAITAAGLPATAVLVAVVAAALVRLRRALRRRARPLFARILRKKGLLAAIGVLATAGALLGGPEAALLAASLFGAGATSALLVPRRGSGALWLGALASLLIVLGQRATGETVSLSTTDVRAAYAIIDGPLGLGGASLAYALRMLLPSAAFGLGLATWLPRARPAIAVGLGAGAILGAVAMLLPASAMLSAPDAGFPWLSLSVSLLLRGLGEVAFVGLSVAFASLGRARSRPV